MKTLSLLGMVVVLGLASGCGTVSAPFRPPIGVVTSISAPLSTEFNPATQVAKLQGESSAISVLGLAALGDCSIKAAADNGRLSKVHYADYSFFSILGIYQKTTVRVYGE